ncbi:hypothetical protein RMAECT_0655 [Rickettsia rhipicephali str. Ect]|uniref:Tetratricopeptide repeat family protein n=2 Tax=spotted fever group TaxID=114277 RepID=A0A0F3PGA6_RICRH|nr:hypothetical protein RMB_00410 [Rickettsia massiliae str. AZT80]KJV78977.1 hypothetical protein RMAECT_0655 [Rickettsia rhipicephali str. Ect]
MGLYENAANLGSEEANIKLGKIEFKSGNYVKALENILKILLIYLMQKKLLINYYISKNQN